MHNPHILQNLLNAHNFWLSAVGTTRHLGQIEPGFTRKLVQEAAVFARKFVCFRQAFCFDIGPCGL